MRELTREQLAARRAAGADVSMRPKRSESPPPAPATPAVEVDLAPIASAIDELQQASAREAEIASRILQEMQRMNADRPMRVRATVTERDRQGRIVTMDFEVEPTGEKR